VQDEAHAERSPLLLGHECAQVRLDFDGVGVRREAEQPGDPQDVGVDRRPGSPRATDRTTLAVLRPTPGSDVRSSIEVGKSDGFGPNLSTRPCAMPMRWEAFDRKKPVDRMISSSSSRSPAASCRGPGYVPNRAGVTMFTRSSVHCAERIVAHRSWKALRCFKAQSSAALPG